MFFLTFYYYLYHSESILKMYRIFKKVRELLYLFLKIFFQKYQETRAIKHAQTLEQEEKEQMTRTEVKSVSKHSFDHAPQHFINQSPHFMAAMAPNRPITVRSVKRRDKAKVEEKKMSQLHKLPAPRSPDERAAVVV